MSCICNVHMVGVCWFSEIRFKDEYFVDYDCEELGAANSRRPRLFYRKRVVFVLEVRPGPQEDITLY